MELGVAATSSLIPLHGLGNEVVDDGTWIKDLLYLLPLSPPPVTVLHHTIGTADRRTPMKEKRSEEGRDLSPGQGTETHQEDRGGETQ